jgi:hypothetical protein
MKLSKLTAALVAATTLTLTGCVSTDDNTQSSSNENKVQLKAGFEQRLNIYKTVTLKTSLDHLNANQKKMIGVLIDAAKIMDDLYWKQAFGESKSDFLNKVNDPKVRNFADINYGPWDRLDGDKPFLTSYGEKPLGAEFYPHDITKQNFEAKPFNDSKGLYSVVERDHNGDLKAIPYSVKYKTELTKTADLLRQASKLAKDPEFANYLQLRADALLSNQYQPSDLAWMDMKNNPIDVVIGPIETYEDLLYGYRTAFEAYVLIKDMKWSEKLAKYASYLPELQVGLPVEQKYKNEIPGSDADLNAYDVVYYAGHSNAGSKTIAINLPNDEEVQLKKGTRRLQLKNAMRAKFDQILVPIANELIAQDQRKYITFNAFFSNTMFHEVAHGLGIKNTINGKGMVRQALQEFASSVEEGKADILGLYMITQLLEKGVIAEGQLDDYYTVFLAGIFRSVRFGASSAHGKANMVRFNYFQEKGAFTRDSSGLYRVNMKKMRDAMNSLSNLLLTHQGNGDYVGISKLMAEKGGISDQLAADLKRLEQANIPVDIVFNQGKDVLGL